MTMPTSGHRKVSLTAAIRFFAGAYSNLKQMTAVASIQIDGEANIRNHLIQLPYAPKESAFEEWQQFPCEIVYLIHAHQKLLAQCRHPLLETASLKSKGDGRFIMYFPYHNKAATRAALDWLIQLINSHDNISNLIFLLDKRDEITSSLTKVGLLPNSLSFVKAAYKQNRPWQHLGENLVQIGWGAESTIFDNSFTSYTGTIGTRMALNKAVTKKMLSQSGVPVSDGAIHSDLVQAKQFVKKLAQPSVVKPLNTDGGIGVTVDIRDEAEFDKAFAIAQEFSNYVLIENYIPGHDHRLLVVGGRLIAASRKIPAGVTGDGQSSIKQLVEQTNKDPRRGKDKRSLLIALQLDDEAKRCLSRQNLYIDSVPAPNQFVYLRKTSNISTGGTAENTLHKVHPDNILLAERIARLFRLDIVGIDLITPDISKSWRTHPAVVCEVNAKPGFRPHWISEPDHDINAEILNILFNEKSGRIPLCAVTGSNGKSTVSMMLAHIMQQTGLNTGVATTAGTFIGGQLVNDKNLSGHPGGKVLLTDPSVEAAVVEMPRKGLIIWGRPFDTCDVALLLNVQDDHIGVDGIDTLEEMADLKGKLLSFATKAVVINADDSRCLAQRNKVLPETEIIFVSNNPESATFSTHIAQGRRGIALNTVNSEEWITLFHGESSHNLLPVKSIPAVMGGAARFNIQNSMFAIAAALAQEIETEKIAAAMTGFHSSYKTNPGRLNLIPGFPFQILLDFAHNPDGVNELSNVLDQLPCSGNKVLVSSKIGNRHFQHITAVKDTLLKHFDTFICSREASALKNSEYEGQPEDYMPKLFAKELIQAGAKPANVYVESASDKAVIKGTELVEDGGMLVLLCDEHEAFTVLDELKASLSMQDALPEKI